MAAVVAARDLGCACTVVVPLSTKPLMIEKLRAAGATDVIQHGASWFEADAYLRENFIDNQDEAIARGKKNVYVPPFDHPDIWEGAASMVSEIAAQLPPIEEETDRPGFPADVIICSVGGGGLFNGIIRGLKDYPPSLSASSEASPEKKVQVLAVETKGADSLAHSLQHGSLQSLPGITSLATTLGALCVAPQTLQNAQSPPSHVEVKSVVGSDADAARGVVCLADELRLQVELACGISVGATAGGKLKDLVPDLRPESRVVVIVCGGNYITAEMIAEYRRQLADGWE